MELSLDAEVLVRDLGPQGVNWGGIVSTEVLVRDLDPQGVNWSGIVSTEVLVRDLGPQGWTEVELFPKVLVRDLGWGGGGRELGWNCLHSGNG